MNKRIIALLGALTLMVSVGGRASVREDIFNRLDNDSRYNALNNDEQVKLDGAVDQAVSNLEEKGIDLSDAGAQMFLIDTVKSFLGLSKGKEDASKPAGSSAAASGAVGMPAANSLGDNLMLVESNGSYFLIDTITNVVNKVIDTGKSILGIGGDKSSKTTTPPPSSGTIFNEMGQDLSLQENAQYGAIGTALGQLGGAVADKIKRAADKAKEVLGGKKEEPMPSSEAVAEENSIDNGLTMVDATAQYGAIWDAVKDLGSAVKDKVKEVGAKVADTVSSLAGKAAGMLKGSKPPLDSPTPVTPPVEE